MLKIRLQRVGRKHDPSYRIVVVEHTTGPKSGKNIEILGNYNPKTDVKTIDAQKVKDWISKGAQLSDTLHNILVSEKIIEGKKVNVLPKKTPQIDEEKIKAEQEAKEKAEQESKEKAEAEAKEKEEVVEEKSEEVKEDVKKDAPEEQKEESKEEITEEAKTETEVKEEAPEEEKKAE